MRKPGQSTWERANERLPEYSETIRYTMRKFCRHIRTEELLSVVDDFLQPVPKK